MANTIQKESKITYLQIGQNYENLGVQKQFDVSEWTAEFPDAHIYLLFKRPGEEAAAPVNTTLDEDGILTWTVSNWETGIIGIGFAEIRAIDSSTGLVKKSHVIPCSIEASVTDEDAAPDYPSWVDRMLQFGENVDSIYATLPDELEEGIASIQQEAQTQIEAIEQKGITTRASIPADYTALSDDVTDLKSALQDRTLYAITDTDLFDWLERRRVNSTKKGYAQGAEKYAGLGGTYSPGVYVYAGSTVKAKTGYTMDYSVVTEYDGTVIEGQRGISAGTLITISHDGLLLLSVTDGATDVTTSEEAKALAKAGLEVNLLYKTAKDEIEEKIDKNQGAENAWKVLMVTQTGDVSPENIPDPAKFVEAKTNYGFGKLSNTGTITTYKSGIVSSPVQVIRGDYITVDNGLYLTAALYNSIQTNSTTFIKRYAWTNSGTLTIDADGYIVVGVSDAEHYNKDSLALPNTDYQYDTHIYIQRTAFEAIADIESTLTEKRTITNKTGLFEAQQAVASDWHLPFINVYDALGLGNNHQIPGTATTWSSSGVTDLTQKNVWMSDGTHPYRGIGLVDMYGRTIANQLAIVSPSYHDGDGEVSPSYWAGKRILWMGTSIPAGSDPDAGSGTGATYPQMVAAQLGATSVNIARGSSMLRVKSSTGLYNAIPFSHYARAITRMVAECDEIADNWANIYSDIPNAPSELTAENIETMKNHSFENLVVPYLDGTNTAPDLYVIDYGHNDYANGIDGKRDWWVKPTTENIESGLLAEDTYMVANDYANLKLALNNDLSGISDLREFAASLNRNCFQGACNFLITVILRYKPYARIVIVSDYN